MTTTVAQALRWMAREGARMSNAQAERYGQELQRLYDMGIALTAENVVAAARKRSSPLHDWFTWEDTLAAQRWRLHEARKMLHGIAFVVEDGREAELEPLRFFVALPVERDGETDTEYLPMPVVHASADAETQMLRIAARELAAYREKYSRLKRLDSIVNWAAFDSLLNELAA